MQFRGCSASVDCQHPVFHFWLSYKEAMLNEFDLEIRQKGKSEILDTSTYIEFAKINKCVGLDNMFVLSAQNTQKTISNFLI